MSGRCRLSYDSGRVTVVRRLYGDGRRHGFGRTVGRVSARRVSLKRGEAFIYLINQSAKSAAELKTAAADQRPDNGGRYTHTVGPWGMSGDAQAWVGR